MAQIEKAARLQAEEKLTLALAGVGIAPKNILQAIPCPSECCMTSVTISVSTCSLQPCSIAEEFVMSRLFVSFVGHAGRGDSSLA